MRQGQQNKRMRGRGRKPTSSLNRVFESNGPDVKIRGPASHVAEKYLNLARDAQSSGDPISAENYLQHAEHYFRIISSAQSQSQQPQPQQPNQPQPVFDQPGGEFNGAAPARAGGSAPAATPRSDDGEGEEPRAEAGGNDSTEAGAEDAADKPRRRRGSDGRARATNGHDAPSQTAAAEKGAGDEDVAAAEDAEPGVDKPAESAA